MTTSHSLTLLCQYHSSVTGTNYDVFLHVVLYNGTVYLFRHYSNGNFEIERIQRFHRQHVIDAACINPKSLEARDTFCVGISRPSLQTNPVWKSEEYYINIILTNNAMRKRLEDKMAECRKDFEDFSKQYIKRVDHLHDSTF